MRCHSQHQGAWLPLAAPSLPHLGLGVEGLDWGQLSFPGSSEKHDDRMVSMSKGSWVSLDGSALCSVCRWHPSVCSHSGRGRIRCETVGIYHATASLHSETVGIHHATANLRCSGKGSELVNQVPFCITITFSVLSSRGTHLLKKRVGSQFKGTVIRPGKV